MKSLLLRLKKLWRRLFGWREKFDLRRYDLHVHAWGLRRVTVDHEWQLAVYLGNFELYRCSMVENVVVVRPMGCLGPAFNECTGLYHCRSEGGMVGYRVARGVLTVRYRL